MELSIRTDSIELTDSLRDLVTRRIRLALDKFDGRIVDTFVYLVALNSPTEDRIKLCLISVRVHGLGEMVVREIAASEAAALDRAACRVKRRVSAAIRNADRRSTDFPKPNFSSRLMTSANRANISHAGFAVPTVAPSAQRRAFSGTHSG
jgi:ribosome-associated translation inhibitor RaiA